MIYQISTGSGDGGKVSSTVAAGIDCLDLIIEYAQGNSPIIFYEKQISCGRENIPDPGSVILMCIEVLTRVSGKHALFQMDSWHVAQSLRVPAALFQEIRQVSISEAPVPSNSAMFSDDQNSDTVASQNSIAVDRQFSINLFAACCRLLYTVLKHHKSESERCIALLEESVRVLLHCLETVDTDWVLRQQKDVFGQHSFKFLSNYIWIYSGCGPLKSGIKREIDEALKPGVYALIDACSADDLQYLHTVFG
ncbi:hypothetical protein CUMW_240420, partial [Citrus unshiu]